MSLPPLNELLAFQRVATRLSFSRASAELSLTPSTLSHLVKSLEVRLKTRLLNRTTRSVALTDAGRKLFHELAPILANLDQALANVGAANASPSGSVRISVNESSVSHVLEKLGGSFCETYPGIEIEIAVDNRLVDIVADGFDAGVRLRDAIPKDMVSVSILDDFRFVTAASPLYLRKHGAPQAPSDLKKHNCIGFRFQSGRLYDWEFSQGSKKVSVAVKGSLITNDPRLMVDAAKRGIGIAYIAEPLISHALASKELVMVLSDWQRKWPKLCLYYPRNRHMSAALTAVASALRNPRGRTHNSPMS